MDLALREANRRHEEHRRERRCLLAEAVYVVDGAIDPTIEQVGLALMQPYINAGLNRIVLMIAEAIGLETHRLESRPTTMTRSALAVAQGLVPDLSELEPIDIEESDLARAAVEEELALIGAGA